MSEKLYNLNEVIGQTNIVNWLKSCIDKDTLPQVILLQGPAGIGKTSIGKIIACEVACMNNPEKLDSVKQAVIGESKSTDCVRLYNMSNLKSQEAVTEVKSDLTIGFSSTGRKVIIMDEAHGMSDEAQDSLLTTFESLQSQVYIIVCTTEVESFRDAFLSRCIQLRLNSLTQTEMRQFLRKRIESNELKFELSLPMVYTLISTYTGREPRRAINLLDSFEKGSLVTTQMLEMFFNPSEGKQLVTLISYMYNGKILEGLDFIANMTIESYFQTTLLDILRTSQDGQSTLLSKDSVVYIRDLIARDGLNNLLGFVIDCTTHNRLTRNMLSGYFLKWCSKSDEIFMPPKKESHDTIHLQDTMQMSTMIENRYENVATDSSVRVETLEAFLSGSDTLEE